jgi:hypothetical protein
VVLLIYLVLVEPEVLAAVVLVEAILVDREWRGVQIPEAVGVVLQEHPLPQEPQEAPVLSSFPIHQIMRRP